MTIPKFWKEIRTVKLKTGGKPLLEGVRFHRINTCAHCLANFATSKDTIQHILDTHTPRQASGPRGRP